MFKQRNYWVYSIGCFLVWGILLVVAAAKAKNGTFHNCSPGVRWMEPLLGVGNNCQIRLPPAQAMATAERIAGALDLPLTARLEATPDVPDVAYLGSPVSEQVQHGIFPTCLVHMGTTRRSWRRQPQSRG